MKFTQAFLLVWNLYSSLYPKDITWLPRAELWASLCYGRNHYMQDVQQTLSLLQNCLQTALREVHWWLISLNFFPSWTDTPLAIWLSRSFHEKVGFMSTSLQSVTWWLMWENRLSISADVAFLSLSLRSLAPSSPPRKECQPDRGEETIWRRALWSSWGQHARSWDEQMFTWSWVGHRHMTESSQDLKNHFTHLGTAEQ